MERREFLKLSALSAGALAFGSLGAACTRRGLDLTSVPPAFKDFAATLSRESSPGLSVFLGASEFIAGTAERIPMRLVDKEGEDVIATSADVYVANRTDPFSLIYRRFSTDSTRGFHETSIPIPGRGGIVDLAVVANFKGRSSYGFAVIDGKMDGKVPSIGEQAIYLPTIEGLCTRNPPCDLHSMSLDTALTAGKPTVLVIGSPKLCSSGVCGPVLDEAISIRSDKASFIHIEPYADDTAAALSKAAIAWGLDSEPWTFVIDAKGMIAARFEGAVTAEAISKALGSVV